jgi:hypothetical protein
MLCIIICGSDVENYNSETTHPVRRYLRGGQVKEEPIGEEEAIIKEEDITPTLFLIEIEIRPASGEDISSPPLGETGAMWDNLFLYAANFLNRKIKLK